jgi:hypothetical protein
MSRTIGEELERLEAELEKAAITRNWDLVLQLANNLKATDRMASEYGTSADHWNALVGRKVVR